MTWREEVVRAAELWLGTPYHHAARVRGVGVDCINFLAAVYEEAGLIDRVQMPFYPSDWMLHRDEERFMLGIINLRMLQVQTPRPGDVALFRFGRCYSHGAIVTAWPLVIHSFVGFGVIRSDASRHPLVDNAGKPRSPQFYSLEA